MWLEDLTEEAALYRFLLAMSTLLRKMSVLNRLLIEAYDALLEQGLGH